MRIYVATNYTGSGWANEWFRTRREAEEAAREWQDSGQRAEVREVQFSDIVGLANGAGLNPVNFCEIEGVQVVR